MNICDHKECPAPAGFAVITPRGVVLLCGHHARENSFTIIAKGYSLEALTEGAKVLWRAVRRDRLSVDGRALRGASASDADSIVYQRGTS